MMTKGEGVKIARKNSDVINGRPKKDRYQADKQKGVTQFSDNPTKLAHPHLYVSKKYKYAWLVLSRFEIPYIPP